MLQKLISISGAMIAMGILWACSANSKLEVIQGEAESIRLKNTQLLKDVNALKSELSGLSAQNKTIAAEFSNYRSQCESDRQKLGDAQSVLKDEYNTLKQIKNKIEDAVAKFAGEGIDVYYKNGFVYVSLSDDLLYKSGSSKLDNKGRDALADLASVLNQYPALKVVVVGNTDSLQLKNGIDNWSLSTERANGVVRIFRDQYKMDPARLTAAGKGKYDPVADNSSAEGRAKNRRTDIILNPDIDRLWDIVEFN